MNTALAHKPAELPQPVTEVASVLSLIQRAATDPNVDIDKMERLLSMHERMSQAQAEQAFNAALAAAQAAIGRIKPNKRNSQTGSNYADYAQLDRIVRPIYSAQGFALSFGTEPCEGDYVRVICHCSHSAGYTRRYEIEMPADGKGAKGNDVMTKTHATGSAMSYGQRYLLRAIFNLAISADDDGNAASRTPGANSGRPTGGAWEAMDQATQAGLLRIAAVVEDLMGIDDPVAAYAHVEAQKLGSDELAALWTQLNSSTRSALKKVREAKRSA